MVLILIFALFFVLPLTVLAAEESMEKI